MGGSLFASFFTFLDLFLLLLGQDQPLSHGFDGRTRCSLPRTLSGNRVVFLSSRKRIEYTRP
jgi:hypothetical protein